LPGCGNVLAGNVGFGRWGLTRESTMRSMARGRVLGAGTPSRRRASRAVFDGQFRGLAGLRMFCNEQNRRQSSKRGLFRTIGCLAGKARFVNRQPV